MNSTDNKRKRVKYNERDNKNYWSVHWLYKKDHNNTVVGRKIGLPREIVRDIVKRIEETGSLVPHVPPGTPKKTDSRGIRYLETVVKLNPFISIQEARNELKRMETNVCKNIIRSHLSELGIYSYYAAHKPVLTSRHKKLRLEWKKNWVRNSSFVYVDGNGNLTNENGEEHLEFAKEVDDEAYPLGDVTDFAMYTDLKPPEKAVKDVVMKTESNTTNPIAGDVGGISKKAYRKYKPEDKSNFFHLVYEKNMSVRGAAKQLGIPPTTAQTWFKQGEASLEKDSEVAMERTVDGKRKLGRPAILNDAHKECLIEAIDERPEMVLEEMMECLT
ncbi:hypothetical protein CU098_005236, partial [Rhizopus stolonifer]